MLPNELLDLPAERSTAEPGAILLRRSEPADGVVFVEHGRVELGLIDGGDLTHLLGTAEGPFWLETSAAILGRRSLVDAIAETPVKMRRLSLPVFRQWLASMPESAQNLLRDVAVEALSRVLRHLRERSLISGSGRVVNLVDPSGLRSLAGV